MRWQPPFIVYGNHLMEAEARARQAEAYRARLEALRDGEG
jgi:putative NADPH-quinone reductase